MHPRWGQRDRVVRSLRRLRPPSSGRSASTVIGSLAAIVAVAELRPVLQPDLRGQRRRDRALASPSRSPPAPTAWSSVAVMVIVCVAPAAELAANVTVPDVGGESALPQRHPCPTAPSTPPAPGASTAADSVTVNSALEPSETLDVGPVMLSSAPSLSPRRRRALVVVRQRHRGRTDRQAHLGRRRPRDHDRLVAFHHLRRPSASA